MSRKMKQFPLFAAAAVVAACVACTPPATSHSSAEPARPAPLSTTKPLTAAQKQWVDKTLASLTLRERVAQMVVVWMLGDYTSSHDSVYTQLLGWVEKDKVGGATVSLGTPMEVATKLNELQRRASIPLLIASDL